MELIFGYFDTKSFYEPDGALKEEPEESLEVLIQQYEAAANRYSACKTRVNEVAAKYLKTRWVGNRAPVFIEDSVRNYGHRTWRNAEWSDITLAIAVNLYSPGEITTKNAAGNKYVSYLLRPKLLTKIDYFSGKLQKRASEEIADIIKRNPHFKKEGIRLNIAGNGQETLDEYGVTIKKASSFIGDILYHLPKMGIPILEVRTGGQTGIDEAAIIAAQHLGIKCSVLAPKGWRYRYRRGEELEGKNGFVARFKEQYVDYDAWEKANEDEMLTYGLAEFNAGGSLEGLEWEIDLKVMHINEKEKRHNQE